jgi:hypothetical protein
MRPSLRLREYIEAAKLAQQRAHSEQNPHAKQILQEIERSYYRLVEIEKWMGNQQSYNRIGPFRDVQRTISCRRLGSWLAARAAARVSVDLLLNLRLGLQAAEDGFQHLPVIPQATPAFWPPEAEGAARFSRLQLRSIF